MKYIVGQRMQQHLLALGLFTSAYGACLAHTNIPAAPLVEAQASPPRYLPDTYDWNPITRMLWVSSTQFIKLPQGYSLDPNFPVLSVTDTVTGKKTPLDRVNSVIHGASGGAADGTMIRSADGRLKGFPFSPYEARLSPDGRWLLWPSSSQGQPIWLAITLDGAERREWSRQSRDDSSNGGAGWMQDNTHFVEISQEIVSGAWVSHASVYSLDTPDVQEFPLDMLPTFQLLIFPNSEVLFTGNGRGWVMADSGERYEILPGAQGWSLHPSPLLTAISLPSGDRASDFALSPSGNWLVWLDNPDGKAKRTQINISRPDGNEARTIFKTGDYLSCGSSFSPRWTSDEQGIVFHWTGYNRIANATNGEGNYLISLAKIEARSHHYADHLASQKHAAGFFPTVAGRTWGTRVAGNMPH